MSRISVDHAACAGIGICEAMAPTLFSVQPDGTLSAAAVASPDLRSALDDAVNGCPTGAITVLDEEPEGSGPA